jgi:hypothetical protein
VKLQNRDATQRILYMITSMSIISNYSTLHLYQDRPLSPRPCVARHWSLENRKNAISSTQCTYAMLQQTNETLKPCSWWAAG